MTEIGEVIRERGAVPEWPYPIRYGVKNEVTADVLVLGGGLAGCHAAINAAKRGAKVVVVEKGATVRSGSAGTGIDHWEVAATNPCSKVSPQELTEAIISTCEGYDCGPERYINCKESWEALLDMEQMGVKIRDVNDEFKGADFRDEKTKLMFAYDYDNKRCIRIGGVNLKPSLHKEMQRLGVEIYDRVMATSLLTEGGKQGTRVVGATGINGRTGEFYVFKAKATVLAMARPGRLWTFSAEFNGFPSTFQTDGNETGDGLAMGWNAGVEFAQVELSGAGLGSPFSYIPYGTGNVDNTWFGTPIVDAKGKEIPYVDRDGKEIKTVQQRFRPAKGQRLVLNSAATGSTLFMGKPPTAYEYIWNHLPMDLPERIMKGEYTLPLYADLTRLPEHERRAIFGLMVGNEGKTRIAVYNTYTKAGFDPDKDMLQVPVMPPDAYFVLMPWWMGIIMPNWRLFGKGGVMVDWDLRTNLDGLYAAGWSIFGEGNADNASATGRYAGRKAAAYALTAPEPVVDRKQVDKEKARVYTPLKKGKVSIGWKELNIGINRIMQDYCGQHKHEETLKAGLRLLNDLRETEASTTYAANPHELVRTLECHSLISVGEMVMHACRARKASSAVLGFFRLDYPEMDPPKWHKFLPIKLVNGKVTVRELPHNYHLLPPYAPTYEENYKLHCGL